MIKKSAAVNKAAAGKTQKDELPVLEQLSQPLMWRLCVATLVTLHCCGQARLHGGNKIHNPRIMTGKLLEHGGQKLEHN